MNINETCAACMLQKLLSRSEDPGYRTEVTEIIRRNTDRETSSYTGWQCEQVYRKHFGPQAPMTELKKQFNDLLLSKEADLEKMIGRSEDPLETALVFSRFGNYIDTSALGGNVSPDFLLSLFTETRLSESDRPSYLSFLNALADGSRFLLIADNCGEIVLDKLLIRQIRRRFPHIACSVMVRGADVSNDATMEDALYTGIDGEAHVLTSGNDAGGIVPSLLSAEASEALSGSDVIVSKGQANFESLSGSGLHVYYSFLCKCHLFTGRFGVPQFTGMFLEEGGKTPDPRLRAILS